jgi:hypothetical protein
MELLGSVVARISAGLMLAAASDIVSFHCRAAGPSFPPSFWLYASLKEEIESHDVQD